MMRGYGTEIYDTRTVTTDYRFEAGKLKRSIAVGGRLDGELEPVLGVHEFQVSATP